MTTVSKNKISIDELGNSPTEIFALREVCEAVDLKWPSMRRSRAIERARKETGFTYEKLAELTGLSKSVLAVYGGLVERLDPEVQDDVDGGLISTTTARKIATIRSRSTQRAVARRVKYEKLSAADVEQVSSDLRSGSEARSENLIAAMRASPALRPIPYKVATTPIVSCPRFPCKGSGLWDAHEKAFVCRMCERKIRTDQAIKLAVRL